MIIDQSSRFQRLDTTREYSIVIECTIIVDIEKRLYEVTVELVTHLIYRSSTLNNEETDIQCYLSMRPERNIPIKKDFFFLYFTELAQIHLHV